jgi:flavin reductase (DIM6/NTAB) family NADH-FMN oxidoreductase RutF
MQAELQVRDGRAAFTDAMSQLANGVVLVTCSVGGRTWGVTVTSFTSVSADPPTVLVSLRAGSTAARAIAATRRYGVVVLAAEHEEIARASSLRGADKFLADGLDDAPARLVCDVVHTLELGSHVVYVGRVVAAQSAGDDVEPLLYHRRSYLCPSS